MEAIEIDDSDKAVPLFINIFHTIGKCSYIFGSPGSGYEDEVKISKYEKIDEVFGFVCDPASEPLKAISCVAGNRSALEITFPKVMSSYFSSVITILNEKTGNKVFYCLVWWKISGGCYVRHAIPISEHDF